MNAWDSYGVLMNTLARSAWYWEDEFRLTPAWNLPRRWRILREIQGIRREAWRAVRRMAGVARWEAAQ